MRDVMQAVVPMSPQQMIEIAARAAGRVLRDDLRGITALSVEEIAAMTGTLIVLGLIPVMPGQPAPDALVFPHFPLSEGT